MIEVPTKYYFTAIPYLNMGETNEIDLGFAKIWNFDLMKDQHLNDDPLRKQVELTLNSYQTSRPYGYNDSTFWPVSGIGIISTSKPINQEPSQQTQIDINDARLTLFVSSIARKNTVRRNVNTGHSMSSSENFAPVHFSVVIDSKHMTEFLGFIVPSMHGGINIEKNIYLRNRHVPTPRLDYDVDLLSALIELRSKRPKLFRRVMSATEIFFESYYNSTEVSHKSRILLQASALETILNTKSNQKRLEMIKYIKKHADYPEDKRITYKSIRNGKTTTTTGTMREKWADSFFTLRNNIIHGDLTKEKDYFFGSWQRHFDIAHYFFIFMIKREIERALHRGVFNDDIVWNTWTDDLLEIPKKITGFEYKNYGRRGWDRLTKTKQSKK